jgi:hypothetical protein
MELDLMEKDRAVGAAVGTVNLGADKVVAVGVDADNEAVKQTTPLLKQLPKRLIRKNSLVP